MQPLAAVARWLVSTLFGCFPDRDGWWSSMVAARSASASIRDSPPATGLQQNYDAHTSG